ncbi:MAG: efflux RND transporter periplasmic adaptor subunit [Luteolibacter sp.]|uniref:efflux RND transporter periplasmic adaptor subunit n=1 Tax=Luteolibacter sp. TaxID=1962973 RepID=UPI0032631598
MDSKPPSLDALRIDRSQTPLKAGSGRGWWALLILLLLAGAGAWWFMRPKGISVKTATVQVQSGGGSGSKTLLNASGYVTTRLDATVSSKITGKVLEILVEEGMKVEKGQIVAKLDASNAEAGLHLAEAQLASAKLNLAETEPMVKYTEVEMKRLTALESTRAVSNSELTRAQAEARTQLAKLEHMRAEITVAERQVDDWKQQVDDTIIRAPFSGVVTTKDSQPGEMISPMSAGGGFTRTGICTLVDMASLEIEVDVGESFINRVKANQPVEATLDAYPEWKIPCKVIAIIPTADRQKATVKVRVAFEKLDPRILPQMGVKVAFQSDETAEATEAALTKLALSVPKEAVRNDNGKDVAWVVRDGKVERRAVTVSNSNSTEAILTAGLSSGEIVVLDPPPTLTDGAAVTVENSR